MSVSARLATERFASASARADRYLARIDERLAHQRPLERRAFLTGLLAGWQYRYSKFVATGGDSEPPAGEPPADCADFLLTITGLSARLAAEPQS